MRPAAALDGVDVVGEVVTEDCAFTGTVPPLLPQEVPTLLHCEELLPGIVDSHDDHAVDT